MCWDQRSDPGPHNGKKKDNALSPQNYMFQASGPGTEKKMDDIVRAVVRTPERLPGYTNIIDSDTSSLSSAA
jgi:hypothetical protein